jgi:hypothetical protein
MDALRTNRPTLDALRYMPVSDVIALPAEHLALLQTDAREALDAIVPALARLLQSGDADVVTDALWGLSYLTDGGEAGALQVALEAGAMGRVCELLAHDAPECSFNAHNAAALAAPATATLTTLTPNPTRAPRP